MVKIGHLEYRGELLHCHFKRPEGDEKSRICTPIIKNYLFNLASFHYKNGSKVDFPRRKSGVMDRYVCNICGYIYDPAEGDPENGIAPGTSFEDLPDNWVCPACGVGKEHFVKEN